MKVVKKINNNVAICIDDNNHELIAFGKGIGFPKMPYNLKDLSIVDKTYYAVNSKYYLLFKDIDEEIFEISGHILEYARCKLDYEITSNVLFTLSDHIDFAIKRYQQKICIQPVLNYELKQLYKKEVEVGYKAIDYINRKKNISLHQDEAYGIALHFIYSCNSLNTEKPPTKEEEILDKITRIIEADFNISIDRNTINYSRFVSHLKYLLKRQREHVEMQTENNTIFNSLKEEYQSVYICCVHIHKYFEENFHWILNNEELLYLMLHINRLRSREDCNH